MARVPFLIPAVATLAVAFVIGATDSAAADDLLTTCHVVEVTVPPYTVGTRVCPPVPVLP